MSVEVVRRSIEQIWNNHDARSIERFIAPTTGASIPTIPTRSSGSTRGSLRSLSDCWHEHELQNWREKMVLPAERIEAALVAAGLLDELPENLKVDGIDVGGRAADHRTARPPDVGPGAP